MAHDNLTWTGKRNMDLEHRAWLSRELWRDRFGVVKQGQWVVEKWDRPSVLKAFRRFERQYGRRPTAADLKRPSKLPPRIGPRRRTLPPYKVVHNLFGSARAAFAAAGYDARPGVAVRTHKLRCKRCGTAFTSTISTTRACSKTCGQWLRRRDNGVPQRPARAYNPKGR